MSERVTMPALGESVTEGTVTTWLKSVGDTVEVDEPLLEVSTDKVDTEIPSPVAGTLTKILVEEDETADVGADLCIIGDADEADDSDDSADSSAGSGSDTQAAKEADGATAETEETVEETTSAEPSAASENETKSSGSDSDSGSGDGQRVTMPALGESVTEGTVTRWLKEEGDDVEADEPLLEVSTDKVDTEIPSPFAGKLTKILVAEDETADVGADLAIIGGSGGGSAPKDEPKQEAPKEEPKEEPKAEPKQEKAAPQEEKAESKQEAPKEEAPAAKEESKDSGSGDQGEQDASSYVTPLVRKLAADNGIDLSTLKGTGVGGRIRKQDVLEAAKAAQKAAEPAVEEQPAAPKPPSSKAPTDDAQQPAPAPGGAPTKRSTPASPKRGTTEKMSRLRKIIAQRMVESLQVSAQLTALVEVDMSRVAAIRARAKNEFQAREGAKLSFLPFIAVATVETLKQFPSINASVDGDNIVYHDAENLGIAVDTEKGLVVPVIKDAGDLNLAGVARKIADLAERTRTNKIGPDELGGGTFTISNIGSNGTISDTPIINQPQVAILGTGAIVKRPVVVQDEFGNESIAIRSMMNLVLTYDHRVVDGADAGRFLSALKRRLEEGSFDV